MATAAVQRPQQPLRHHRRDPPRLSLGKRSLTGAGMGDAGGSNSDGSAAKKRKLEEPLVRTNEYILKKHANKQPSMVIHLHNSHWKFGGQDGSFGYDSPMACMLRHVQASTVPHELMEELLREGVQWYDGCLIVEVYNHRTAGGKEKDKGKEEDQRFSMHNYNPLITPSPFVPYPKAANVEEVEQREKSAEAGDEGRKKEKGAKGPRVFTTVLHPTELSRHHEKMILAMTPASELRGNKKKASAETPSTANPPTPSTSGPASSNGPLTGNQKMALEEGDLNSFEGDLLVATLPPLYLEPASNPEESDRIIDMLSVDRHSNKPPSPKTRKRTTAEMAADDAQAAEAERRMLIMDERIKPSARGGAGANAESNHGTAATLSFSRFKTLEMVRQKHDEDQRIKKEEEARLALEKRQHDEQVAHRQAQQKQREMMAAQQMQASQGNGIAQRQALLHAQQAQHKAQIAAAVAAGQHGHPNAAMAQAAMIHQHQQQMAQQQQNQQNQQNQFQQQQNSNMAGMQGSPVVRQQTPSNMLNSSPMMAQGGFPMVPTSSQGAGSPPRPTTGMQNRNVQMARQASQQFSGSQGNTPQIPQGTPSMGNVMPNRQMSQTPRMQPNSPAVQNTPHSAGGMNMAMNAPQMMPNGLTPEQLAMLQQQQRMQAMMNHSGSPGAMSTPTPEQMQHFQQQQRARQQAAMMHAQRVQMGQLNPQQQQQMQQIQAMRHAHMQQQRMLQQQALNAGSPAVHATPTPQMAHAHPQTPQPGGGNQADMFAQQQQMQQQMQQQSNNPAAIAAAQQKAAIIAKQRAEASAILQRTSNQYGGFNNIPQQVMSSLPPNAQALARQQITKQNEARLQQMRLQQQAQNQMQMGANEGVVPGNPDPRYMAQLRQQQGLLQGQMAGFGGNQGGVGGQQGGFGNGGGGFGAGAGDALSQHFANMQNALNRNHGNGGGQGQ